MQVTSIGHAGFRIDTPAGSILCDPWVNPAYFASWFPFPDNSRLDWNALGDCDYLYVSHLHKDHFDAKLLTEHVNKDATVLLPEDLPAAHALFAGQTALPSMQIGLSSVNSSCDGEPCSNSRSDRAPASYALNGRNDAG